MCDCYVLPDQLAAEREFLPAQAWWKFTAKFNVAAQQYVPAIRVHDGQAEGMMMRWGLFPRGRKARAPRIRRTASTWTTSTAPTSTGCRGWAVSVASCRPRASMHGSEPGRITVNPTLFTWSNAP